LSTVYLRFPVRSAAAPGAAAPARAALLERMLARADRCAPATDWRSQAFRLISSQGESVPGFGAVALHADLGPVDGVWACLATPVHCEAAIAGVRLPAGGILSLERAEAEALAGDFNRVFSDAGLSLLAGRLGTLYGVFGKSMLADTHDPEDAIDCDIWDFLPSGPDSPQLRRLMSEIEMWLFEHALNRARLARGTVPVTGLWLWGGGGVLAHLPILNGWTAGNDPVFGAFPPVAKLPRSSGPGVVVLNELPGTAGWREAELRWVLPAIAELRSGRITQIDLSAGRRCFSLGARWSWRVWRRTQPWWEFLNDGA
jgi:hypothetical protein